jgi:glycine cleavage system H lipoate-binding protein
MNPKIPEAKNHCIWMEAGVIDFKLCNSDFACDKCEFHRAITEAASRSLARQKALLTPAGLGGEAASWEDKMRQRFGEKQKCHLMATRSCHQCSFDELLEEQFDFFLAPERPKVQETLGILVPITSFLHRGHTWVALENAGRVRLGLDDFSQKVLGPADHIRLPEAWQFLQAGEVMLEITRQGRKAAFQAPLDGIVEVVNPRIRENPRLVHDDPFGEGWLLIVTPTNLKADLEKMLFGQCNLAWTESESQRLLELLKTEIGVTLPSGGTLIADVFGNYPQLGWERLVHEFLHTP